MRELLKKAEDAAIAAGQGMSLRDEMRQRWSSLIEGLDV